MKEQKGFLYHFKVEIAEEPENFFDHRHDAAGNNARRRCRGRESERPALRKTTSANMWCDHCRRNCRAIQRSSFRSSPTSMWISNSAPAFSKSRPRTTRRTLKSAQRHKLAADRSHRGERHDERDGGRGLARPRPFRGAQSGRRKAQSNWARWRRRSLTRTTSVTASAADVPIEPRLSEQWFLKYPSVEKPASA